MSLTVIRAGAPIAETPVGAIQGYAGSSAPAGWLLCDGTAVSRTSYAELFGVIGTTYGSGDGSTTFNLPNTTGYIIYATRLATRVTVNNPPQYVTALPASPTDGQEVYYAADATNGVIWHLRYRGSSSSSYKWEFVGGSELLSEVNYSSGTITSNTYTAITGSPGPSVTVPLAGDYMVTIAARVQSTAGYAVQALMSYDIGGTAASDDDSMGVYAESSTVSAHVFRTRKKTSIAASTTFTAKYRRTGGAISLDFNNRAMIIAPVRVG